MSGADEGARYERSDAEARPLLFAGVLLAVVIAVALAVSAWLAASVAGTLAEDAEPSPLRDLRQPAEGLALQPLPARELAAHRAWEDALLHGTAWVDPVNRIVRIPIERALELSLREGFPVRPAAATEERR